VAHGAELKQVIPVWTGHNGYEEFVKAAMLVTTPEFLAVDSYVRYREDPGLYAPTPTSPSNHPVKPPPGIDPKATLIDLYRIETKRAAPALDLIRAGCKKPVTYPKPVSDATLFPELSRFKVLARIFARKADVDYADGHGTEAEADLSDGLAFAYRIPGADTISPIVGANSAISIYAVVERHLKDLSQEGAEALERLTAEALDGPDPYVEGAVAMRKARRADFDLFFSDPSGCIGNEQEKALEASVKLVKSISAAEREKLYKAMFRFFEAPWKAVELRLRGSEADWLKPLDTDNVPGYEGGYDTKAMEAFGSGLRSVAMMIIEFDGSIGFDDTNYDAYVRLDADRKIRERMFVLTCSIVENWRKTGKLPDRLTDLPESPTEDPVFKDPYTYTKKDGAFRIACQIKGVGALQLTDEGSP